MFEITTPTPALVERFCERIRALDADEIRVLLCMTPERAIPLSIRNSLRSWVWTVDGEPGFVAGISSQSLAGQRAEIWVSSTDLVPRHPKAFIRACREILPQMEAMYPELEAWIDARYDASLRWARHMGFSVADPVPRGLLNYSYHHVTKRGARGH